MELSQIIPHIESLIFAADRPLPLLEILDLTNNALAFLEDRASLEQVETALEAIKEKYSTEFYPFEVRESGGGYQFLTKKEYYQTVAQLNGEKFLKRLSTAALETLAIVAYKQPISKGEIEHIRGVSTDYSIQKLLEKELIVISGRSETLPGKPLLYSTSKAFMDYFGLNSPKDLPKLKEVFEDETVQPTLIDANGNTESPEEDGPEMEVSETGELIERESPKDALDGKVNGYNNEPEILPVVDGNIPADDKGEAEEEEKTAADEAKLTIIGGIADIEDANENAVEQEETDEDESIEQKNAEDENDPSVEDAIATDDDIAAILGAAADLGPKGDDEEDDEEDEDFDDEEDDEDSDDDGEDDDDADDDDEADDEDEGELDDEDFYIGDDDLDEEEEDDDTK